MSYQRWVALTIAAAGGKAGESGAVDRVVSALKIDERAARTVIAEMTTASMLTADGTHLHLTDAGQNLYGRIRAAVDETIADLYKGIPVGDLEIAGRVLTEITRRMNAKLRVSVAVSDTGS